LGFDVLKLVIWIYVLISDYLDKAKPGNERERFVCDCRGLV